VVFEGFEAVGLGESVGGRVLQVRVSLNEIRRR